MKVLLSAYACEPNRGSEPGVGWHWALEVARRGHQVWVLTRANNREVVEAEVRRMGGVENLCFLYYDLPPWAKCWKKGGRGVHLYYLLWQWGAYRLARRIHSRERFELVHHITFGVIRQPSFMGGLGVPFIFGPVGGGERAPWRLRLGYSWRGLLLDAVRDLFNLLSVIDPTMRCTFSQAKWIVAKTSQSFAALPRSFHSKTSIRLEIGIEPPTLAETGSAQARPLRVLFVGRFIYWKGMHLGFPAFAKLLRARPEARLTMVGGGPEEGRWRRLAARLGISESIDWVPWTPHGELAAVYARHDLFLFPSLRDSSGNVVLEAMSHGLPVVCLGLGGPGVLVNDSCGRVIKTAGRSRREVEEALGQALVELAEDEELRRSCSRGALERAREFAWPRVVSAVYEDVEQALGGSRQAERMNG
jgi:glycosyltransferase involved in cell wall biosynthesis